MTQNPKPRTQNLEDPEPVEGNPLDAPFGEPFAVSLAKQYPETPAKKNHRPSHRRESNPLPIQPGSYAAKISGQVQGSTIHLIDKHHIGPWHPVSKILDHLKIVTPYGYGRLDKIAPNQATLKIHHE